MSRGTAGVPLGLTAFGLRRQGEVDGDVRNDREKLQPRGLDESEGADGIHPDRKHHAPVLRVVLERESPHHVPPPCAAIDTMRLEKCWRWRESKQNPRL